MDKAVAKRDEGLPIIITGKDKETGLGKTRVAGAYLRRCAEKEVATGRRVLIAYAAKTSELAKDQGICPKHFNGTHIARWKRS